MDSQFAAISRPSASSVEAWLFRKVFRAGTVVPNAIATADVDGDGAGELLMGSTEGVFAILKPNRRAALLSVPVPGTVSAVCHQDDAAYVVSMEGVLTIFGNLSSAVAQKGAAHSTNNNINHSTTGRYAADSSLPLMSARSVTVPANVTCVSICGDYIVMGASDRKVHLIDRISYAHVRSYFVGSQVFSVASLEVDSASSGEGLPLGRYIFAAGTSHLALIDPSVPSCSAPSSGSGVGSGIVWSFKIDRGAFDTAKEDAVAGGDGAEGGVNPALPVCASALRAEHGSFMAAATEDGYCFLFSVRRVGVRTEVASVWGSSGPDATDGVKVSGGIQRIYMATSSFDFRRNAAVIVLSSSGEVKVIDEQRCMIASRVIPNAGAFGFVGVLPGDRVSIAAVTMDEVSCFHIPCGALGAEGCTSSNSQVRAGARGGLEAPPLEELVAVGRAMFPLLGEMSDTFVAQRAMRSLLFGYSSAEWSSLGSLSLASDEGGCDAE